MPGSASAGPLGAKDSTPKIDKGTLARTAAPAPGTLNPAGVAAVAGATAAAATAPLDPAIEALNLRGAARESAEVDFEFYWIDNIAFDNHRGRGLCVCVCPAEGHEHVAHR